MGGPSLSFLAATSIVSTDDALLRRPRDLAAGEPAKNKTVVTSSKNTGPFAD